MANDFEIDFAGTRQLYNFIEDFERKYDRFNKRFMRNAGLRVLRLTKKNTPVGDYPDDVAFWARKSAGSSELNLVELNDVGGGSGGTLRDKWEVSGVKKYGEELEVQIYSDVEYAPYVEYGHRTVAFNSHGRKVGWWEGYHMGRDAVKEVQDKFPVTYEAAFTKFIASLGANHG